MKLGAPGAGAPACPGARLTANVTTQSGVAPVRASAVVATTKALVGIERGGGLEQRIGAWIVLRAGSPGTVAHTLSPFRGVPVSSVSPMK